MLENKMQGALSPHRRKRIIRLPEIDWVEIPAGEFIYGEGRSRRTLHLETFYIGRYPITNGQYQCFIDDGGYGDKRWWGNLQHTEYTASDWPQANRPKVNVTWYEAMAFCRWLSFRFGYEVRLPTEQEWEKAARGNDVREYPWGNGYQAGYANINDKSEGGDYLKQTTAVGVYTMGASPYGVMDMAGNIWEWCLNKYDHPEHIEPDTSSDSRVLRGGSWLNDPVHARAAFRFWFSPVHRFIIIGFRVVCRLPSTDH